MIIIERVFKTSLIKATLKKITGLGIAFGLGFGAWRYANGQYKRAAA